MPSQLKLRYWECIHKREVPLLHTVEHHHEYPLDLRTVHFALADHIRDFVHAVEHRIVAEALDAGNEGPMDV